MNPFPPVQQPEAAPSRIRKLSMDGVGDEIPSCLAVCLPFAKSLTTILARTPSSDSGLEFVTHRQLITLVLCRRQKSNACFSVITLPASTKVKPFNSFFIARNVPCGSNSSRVVSETAPVGFQSRTRSPHSMTSSKLCLSPEKLIDSTDKRSSNNKSGEVKHPTCTSVEH